MWLFLSSAHLKQSRVFCRRFLRWGHIWQAKTMEQVDQLRLGDIVHSLNGRRLSMAISANDLSFLAVFFGSGRWILCGNPRVDTIPTKAEFFIFLLQIKLSYSWIADQPDAHETLICQRTRRTKTLLRPPLKSSWRGVFRSSDSIFV